MRPMQNIDRLSFWSRLREEKNLNKQNKNIEILHFVQDDKNRAFAEVSCFFW